MHRALLATSGVVAPGSLPRESFSGCLKAAPLWHEITHCFPFPSGTDETVDDEDFQLTMMRRLRQVNVDHQHVGWYQSSQFGNFLSSQVISISQTCLDLISSFSFWSPNSRIKLQLTSLCVWCSTRPKPARVFCLSRPTGSPPSFPTKLSRFPAG